MTPQQKLELLEQVAEIRTCQHCGKEYAAVRERERIYCSPECRKKAHRANKKLT